MHWKKRTRTKDQRIEHLVNLRQSQIEKVLKLLVVEPQSPVMRIDGEWYRTQHPTSWTARVLSTSLSKG